jgi:predicted RNase H-like HicB family nuclease
MRYPILVEPGDATHAYGVTVPDLPGCYSAGDTIDEAITNAEEAIAVWIDATLDDGAAIPRPSDVATLTVPTGWIVGVVAVDPAMLDDTVERVNVTIPRRVLARLDAQAKALGQTRSAYIATLSLLSPA